MKFRIPKVIFNIPVRAYILLLHNNIILQIINITFIQYHITSERATRDKLERA